MSNLGAVSHSYELDDRAYDIIIAYSSGAISAAIIPIQLLVLKTIFIHPDLWNNASYRILFRLIVLECIQSIALIVTSLFIIIPNLLKIIVLRKACSVILSTVFLMGFALMSELSIYRILVVTKRCQPDKLPLPMLIIEGLCYVIIIALSIPVYVNESMKFQDSDWEYDTRDLYAKILDKAEVFFCIPVLLLTYLAYLILTAMIYGKRKTFSGTSNAKQEWLLFVQSTFITVYYVYLIADWHFIVIIFLELFTMSSIEIFVFLRWFLWKIVSSYSIIVSFMQDCKVEDLLLQNEQNVNNGNTYPNIPIRL